MNFVSGFFISLFAHIALIVLLLVNFHFSKITVDPAGANKPIQAKAVSTKNVEKYVEQLRNQKLEQKRLEQKRLDDIKKAEQQLEQKRIEEERRIEDAKKKQSIAEQKRKDEEKKAEELKQKRIQEEKDKAKQAEADRKRKAEEEKKRKAEEERKRKIEEEKKRKAAEEKARLEALEKEMQAAMAAESAELEAARQAQILSEVDKYNQLIYSRIRNNWYRPEKFGSCDFRIRLAPGGLVIDIEILGGDAAHCESGKRAIMRSEPLPVPSDADVFNQLKIRTFRLEKTQDEE